MLSLGDLCVALWRLPRSHSEGAAQVTGCPSARRIRTPLACPWGQHGPREPPWTGGRPRVLGGVAKGVQGGAPFPLPSFSRWPAVCCLFSRSPNLPACPPALPRQPRPPRLADPKSIQRPPCPHPSLPPSSAFPSRRFFPMGSLPWPPFSLPATGQVGGTPQEGHSWGPKCQRLGHSISVRRWTVMC